MLCVKFLNLGTMDILSQIILCCMCVGESCVYVYVAGESCELLDV